MAVMIAKSATLAQEVNGQYTQVEMLPGTYQGLQNYKCYLKAGCEIEPQKYADKAVIYCFTRGRGYLTTDLWAQNITELCFFAPDFDRGNFKIHAIEDMEFICLVSELTQGDVASYNKIHNNLPQFIPFSSCQEYTQDCKGPNTRSWSVLSKNGVGRVILGVVKGYGEGTVEKGHPSVAQWNYGLSEADFKLTVEDETVAHGEGDWSYVPAGLDHSLVADPGKCTHYIWYEHFVEELND